jgi:hypothetical protein
MTTIRPLAAVAVVATLFAGYLGVPHGAHGLDERVGVEAFHGQIDIWTDMLRDLAC